MDEKPPRRWRWTAFAAGIVIGLIIGIPLGAAGLIVLLQIVAAMIAPV
jgi:hypothetical protein